MPLPPTPYKHCPNTNEFHEKIKTVENQSLSIATCICQVSCAKANRQLSIIMLSEPEQGWFLIEFSKWYFSKCCQVQTRLVTLTVT